MRIGVITHHNVPNYGAVLQAYALQQAIMDMGYDCDIIDYRDIRVERFYHYSLIAQNSIKEVIRHFLYFRIFARRNRVFKEFRKHNFVMSAPCSKKALKKINSEYDLFISGSDQVWNLALHNGDTSYFLDFVFENDKKGSYAASFGYSTVPTVYIDATKYYLQMFSYINVRESEGVTIARELTGKEVNQVVDPTILLDKDKWMRFIKPIKFENYIFVYEICRLDESYRYALELAEQTGKRVIAVTPFDRLKGVAYQGNIEWINFLSPEEFLSLIYYADYVVTSSFHGTVFSLLFEKKFLCTMNNKSETNSRIKSLLEMVGLSTRLTRFKNMSDDIDYSKIHKLLSFQIKNSRAVLNNMIENAQSRKGDC